MCFSLRTVVQHLSLVVAVSVGVCYSILPSRFSLEFLGLWICWFLYVLYMTCQAWQLLQQVARRSCTRVTTHISVSIIMNYVFFALHVLVSASTSCKEALINWHSVTSPLMLCYVFDSKSPQCRHFLSCSLHPDSCSTQLSHIPTISLVILFSPWQKNRRAALMCNEMLGVQSLIGGSLDGGDKIGGKVRRLVGGREGMGNPHSQLQKLKVALSRGIQVAQATTHLVVVAEPGAVRNGKSRATKISSEALLAWMSPKLQSRLKFGTKGPSSTRLLLLHASPLQFLKSWEDTRLLRSFTANTWWTGQKQLQLVCRITTSRLQSLHGSRQLVSPRQQKIHSNMAALLLLPAAPHRPNGLTQLAAQSRWLVRHLV